MEIIQSGKPDGDYTKFERAVDRMEGLETIPAVAQRLISLASDPNASFEDIEQLLASDAALTTRVLRMAASALYGGQPANSLQAALVRLGLNEVRKLAAAAAMVAKSTDAFHRNLWQYTLGSAVLAEMLSKRLGSQNFCEPFVCGLLHELGTLVMAKIEGDLYQSVVGEIGSHAQVAREEKVYGFTHCDIGALAAERWNLFDGLEQVIQFHHDPFRAELLAFPASILATIHLVALAGRVMYSPEDAFESETTAALIDRLGASMDVVGEELEHAQSQMGDYLTLLR